MHSTYVYARGSKSKYAAAKRNAESKGYTLVHEVPYFGTLRATYRRQGQPDIVVVA